MLVKGAPAVLFYFVIHMIYSPIYSPILPYNLQVTKKYYSKPPTDELGLNIVEYLKRTILA